MEPQAPLPARRLFAIRQLSSLGVPVSAMLAPVISAINDHEVEHILEKVTEAGVMDTSYVLFRLPYEVAPLFRNWLLHEYPSCYRQVMSLLCSMHDGKNYDTKWRTRIRGSGLFAEMIAQRFRLACKRLGLRSRKVRLSACDFRPPSRNDDQLSLF
ncbi:MAG: hypothetical protein JSC189_000241 [Candidatus Tokpelaia sp. JSC189]|nr:MAG: hypothetical protein JSC189_000241 [Candidatus Tokpelaia sp. JSC189]